MRTQRCRGVTPIELITLVFVIAILLAILVTVLESGRKDRMHGRCYQCANNMRNLGLALVNYQMSKIRFPNAGTFVDDPAVHQGDPLKSNIIRAIADPATSAGGADPWLRSWVVEILPYIDAQDMYNAWNLRESYLSTVPSDPSLPRQRATRSDRDRDPEMPL